MDSMATEFHKLNPKTTSPTEQSVRQAPSYNVEHDETRSRKLACGFDPLDDTPQETFDWFDPEIHKTKAAQEQAFNLKQDFVDWVAGDSFKFLTVLGGVGVGKSELAKSAVWQLTPAWHDRHSYYITAAEFDKRVKDFNNAKNNGSVSVDPDIWVERLAAAEHLVIDDIGSGYIDKGWTQARLERLFDLRYRYKLPTVVISNLSQRDLSAEIGERSYSRLSDASMGVVMVLDQLTDVRKIARG
jgi:DNA replication protein DnaC